MLLSADILPQNTMYNNIRYDEPQKLGGLQPPPCLHPCVIMKGHVFVAAIPPFQEVYH